MVITTNARRCCYCGACVSICPVDALVLEDTNLYALDSCTSCAKCVRACPVGALSLEGVRGELDERAPEQVDVLVIGGGPGGAVAARCAAQAGLSVLLVDKRQEIGSPVQCAEGVGHALLAPMMQPDPRWISATIRRARIVTMGEPDAEMDLDGGDALGYVLERRVFDRALVEGAVAAGVRAMVKTRAVDLLTEAGATRGVLLEGPTWRQRVDARIVIGADGVESMVGRWAGIDTRLALQDLMTCAQYLMAGIDIDPACTYYFINDDMAPGGYAWIFPKGGGCANVGLGLQSDLAEEPAQAYLDRFIERYSFLSKGSPVCLITGGVSVSAPLERLAADGLMLVGDAAHQVDPLTGGGITNAMTAGQMAAEVAAQAIQAGNTTAASLGRYEARWARGLGRRMVRNYRFRQRFPPGRRIDPRFLNVFAMAVGGGK